MKDYFVVRLCNKEDGSTACPVKAFDTQVEAEKEFYRSCAAAVDSENLTDSVIFLDKDGNTIKKQEFSHPGTDSDADIE